MRLLLRILIPLVLKFGIPYVLEWLRKRFPSLDLGEAGAVLKEHVAQMKDLNANKRAVEEKTQQRLRECSGVACPPDLKV